MSFLGHWEIRDDSGDMIKFFCSCGKRVRAHESFVGRRARCPRCGSSVLVPHDSQLAPSVRTALPARETAAPPSPVLATTACGPPGAPMTAAPGGTAPGGTAGLSSSAGASIFIATQVKREDRGPVVASEPLFVRPERVFHEKHWAACLLSPLRDPWMLIVLAGLFLPIGLAAWMVIGLAGVGLQGLVLAPLLLVWPASRLAAFLSSILEASVLGRRRRVVSLRIDDSPALDCLGRFLVLGLVGCVLSGVPMLLYWIRAGAIDLLDAVILAELALPGAAYALVGLMLATQGDSIRRANPFAVAAAVFRAGASLVPVVLTAAVAMVMCGGLLAAGTLLTLSGDAGAAFGVLAAFGVVSLYSGMALMRMLGWLARRLSAAPATEAPRTGALARAATI